MHFLSKLEFRETRPSQHLLYNLSSSAKWKYRDSCSKVTKFPDSEISKLSNKLGALLNRDPG